MAQSRRRQRGSKRRGLTLVFVLVSTVTLVGVCALVADVGQLYTTRAKLQRAADAAALAGVQSYYSTAGLSQNHELLESLVTSQTQNTSLQNQTFNLGTILESADVAIGAHDFNNRMAALDTSGAARFNAVELTLKFMPGSANGGVPLFFAPLLGLDHGAVTSTARAAMDDRFGGYRAELDPGQPLVPFTIDVELNNWFISNGDDDFAYDDGIVSDSDGVPEVILYPWKNGGGDGAGNFGLLDFAGNNTPAMDGLIRNGVTAEQLESAMGTSHLVYADAEGTHTYSVPGTPGMKAALEDAVQSRVGELIGYFIHDQIQGTGNNTVYRNVGLRFGRVMAVQLKSGDKQLVVQPVGYTSAGVQISEYAPSSNGMVGRVMLVR